MNEYSEIASSLAETSRWIYAQGWSPATSSNFSQRVDDAVVAITVSGKHKGRLSADDIMRVDLDGAALDNKKPSAETLLHTTLYKRDSSIGAVLHTHSLYASLLSMQLQAAGERQLIIEGLELLKAFDGYSSHEQCMSIPVFANTQDIAALAEEVEVYMQAAEQGHAYLIAGHGVYTWGKTMADCLRHLEALEYLFHYVWEAKKA